MEFIKGCLQTCWKILIRPTPSTFIVESEKGKNRFSAIVVWLVLTGIYLALFLGIAAQSLAETVFFIFLFPLMIPITIILMAAMAHFLYRRVFHREQYIYDNFLYITASIFFVFCFIGFPLSLFLPKGMSGELGLIILAYQFVLITLALASIGRLMFWEAVSIMSVAAIAGLGIFICIVPFLASMIGGVSRVVR